MLAVQYGFMIGNEENSFNSVHMDEFIKSELFDVEMIKELKSVEMWREFTIDRDGVVNYRVLSALLMLVGGRGVWNSFFYRGKEPASRHIAAVAKLLKGIVEEAIVFYEESLRSLEERGCKDVLPCTILSSGLEILHKVKYESLF
jgi:hypothetical protein